MLTTEPKLNPAAPFFNKGKRYYKIGFYIFLWVMLFTQVAKVLPDYAIIKIISAALIAIPALAEYVIVPMAIANIIKSYIHKEPYNKYRMFYLIVLAGVAFFLIIFLVAISGDIRAILK